MVFSHPIGPVLWHHGVLTPYRTGVFLHPIRLVFWHPIGRVFRHHGVSAPYRINRLHLDKKKNHLYVYLQLNKLTDTRPAYYNADLKKRCLFTKNNFLKIISFWCDSSDKIFWWPFCSRKIGASPPPLETFDSLTIMKVHVFWRRCINVDQSIQEIK